MDELTLNTSWIKSFVETPQLNHQPTNWISINRVNQ